MIDWIVSNQELLWQAAAVGGGTAVAGAVVVPWFVVRMPPARAGVPPFVVSRHPDASTS